MDVREKLVELIMDAKRTDPETGSFAEYLADHLIANGVTVQEWISVDERLPEHGDVVLCFMKFGGQRLLLWDGVSSRWLGYGLGDDWKKTDVANWMPLPNPPKGE